MLSTSHTTISGFLPDSPAARNLPVLENLTQEKQLLLLEMGCAEDWATCFAGFERIVT